MPLPGLSSAGMGGILPIKGIVSSTAGSTNSGTSLIINRPADWQIGDVFVAVMATRPSSSAARTWTGASGWTEHIDQNAKPSNMRVATLTAAGGEPSSYTFTCSGSEELIGQIICVRGYSYDVVGASVATLSDVGNVAMTGVTLAGGLLFAAVVSEVAIASYPTIDPPSGMTLVRQTSANFVRLATFYKAQGAGATGTVNSAVTPDGASAQSAGILVGVTG